MARGKVYSVRYDKRQASKINKIMLSYPDITQKQLSISCITNEHRLKYLHNEGLINISHTFRRLANVAKNT